MAMFLNTPLPYKRYKKISKTTYFVDKTCILNDILGCMEEETQYICITRPRRFGKTIMANMLGAFFGKSWNSSLIFDHLKISESEKYQKYLNQYDIIYIDFSRLPENCTSYRQYITGILPISKYSSGSELNMFMEFKMTSMEMFGEYFGFTDAEVDILYKKYMRTCKNPQVSRQGLQEWYDGYFTVSGKRLYNPRSVVMALRFNQLSNYWTSSGPYDEIFYYIRNDIDQIKNDLVLMISGEGIEAKIDEFAASAMELKSRNQIYSAMVVYGLLTFSNGKVSIPNKELMLKYEELLQNEKSLGYVYQLAQVSDQMLNATLAGGYPKDGRYSSICP